MVSFKVVKQLYPNELYVMILNSILCFILAIFIYVYVRVYTLNTLFTVKGNCSPGDSTRNFTIRSCYPSVRIFHSHLNPFNGTFNDPIFIFCDMNVIFQWRN